jgi:hypothetical protein
MLYSLSKKYVLKIVHFLISRSIILKSQIRFGTRFSKQYILDQLKKWYHVREKFMEDGGVQIIHFYPRNSSFPQIQFRVDSEELRFSFREAVPLRWLAVS